MLPTLSTALRAYGSPACRRWLRRWPLHCPCVLAAATVALLLGGCGNKGDLYLPSTLDDDLRLERIGAQGLLEPTRDPPLDPTLDDPLAPTADELLVGEPPGDEAIGDPVGDVTEDPDEEADETGTRKRDSAEARPGAGS